MSVRVFFEHKLLFFFGERALLELPSCCCWSKQGEENCKIVVLPSFLSFPQGALLTTTAFININICSSIPNPSGRPLWLFVDLSLVAPSISLCEHNRQPEILAGCFTQRFVEVWLIQALCHRQLLKVGHAAHWVFDS